MPIFRQVSEIERGQKRRTRRLAHDGEELIHGVLFTNGRRKWAVNHHYAIVPKRGQPAVKSGRIRIFSIWKERLHDVTLAEAILEGVDSVEAYQALWDSINDRPGRRWRDNPWAWVVAFEFVPNIRIEQLVLPEAL